MFNKIKNLLIYLIHYKNNIILYLLYFTRIKKLLKTRNIVNIGIMNFKNWHHGYAYFYGFNKDLKVFIKVDIKLHLLQNDLLVYNIVNQKLKNYLIEIIDSFILNDIQIIVYKYIEHQELSKEIITSNPSYIDEILDIIMFINENNIIHRDIKLDNFILVNNKIKVIDFTFAQSNDKNLKFKELNLELDEHCLILDLLGNNFNPRPFYWNDFYAIRKILAGSVQEENTEIKKSLLKFKGYKTQNYNINCNDRYLQKKKKKVELYSFLNIKHFYKNLDEGDSQNE